ncbi:MAG: metal-dependent transcriptional regulator [Salinivirgaceae bacterium]|jgi:DtxR family Mn-dependent transcriptional regulator|nr:metal-dependent transcriptional regulator [Salinivirgaceae bacterium]
MTPLSLNARIFLTTLHRYELKNERLRTTHLAQLLEVSKAAITEISRSLSANNYIEYEPYQPYAITPQGKKMAARIYERVSIIEKYYFIHFKIDPYTARKEAYTSEPSISDLIIDGMKRNIPTPEIGLFGDVVKPPLDFTPTTLLKCEENTTVEPIAIYTSSQSYEGLFWAEIAHFMGKKLFIANIDREVRAIQIIVENEPRHIGFNVAGNLLVKIAGQQQIL